MSLLCQPVDRSQKKFLNESFYKNIAVTVTEALVNPFCMHQTLHFRAMSGRQFECAFSLHKDFRWPEKGQLSVLSFPVRQQFTDPDGRLDWPGRETQTKNLDFTADDSGASSDCSSTRSLVLGCSKNSFDFSRHAQLKKNHPS